VFPPAITTGSPYSFSVGKKLCTTGGKTAEVPVLRLRQAFWLFAVGGCAARFFLSGALRLLTFFICLLL